MKSLMNQKICFHQEIILLFPPYDTPKGLSQEAYMDIAFAQIRACDTIFMILGWDSSLGCVAEHAYATKIGLKILYRHLVE